MLPRMFQGEKPAIPELPKTKAELHELLKQDFVNLSESATIDAFTGGEWHPGSVALSVLKRQCPFCQCVFTASRKQGCFSHDITPHNCPNCQFPSSVSNAILALIKEERENKQ